jgi:hypothetical protein
MITASVKNSNLIIYSTDTVTGFNTNYAFVFDNNVFRAINTYTVAPNQVNVTLANSINPDHNAKLNLYSGGITTSGGANIATSIMVANSTIFVDDLAPSLMEMIQQNNYSFTSVIYSNYTTGITTGSSSPSANFILKRQPPVGQITINEGFLGPMQVHRFAALSSTVINLGQGIQFNTLKYFAGDFNVFGDQNLLGVGIQIGSLNGFGVNAKAYLTINQDYFDSPSPVILGVSTTVDFSNLTAKASTFAQFTLANPLLLSQGKYWFIVTPTTDSSIGLGDQYIITSGPANEPYTTQLLESTDGVVYNLTQYTGVSYTIYTDRGMVLASDDSIYDQLNQPQPIPVNYGDESNFALYTSLAVPITSHYIKKSMFNYTPIYAIETLITSSGQNEYQIFDEKNNTYYYNMISNALTQNIIRYNFNSPITTNELRLISLGDYYATSTKGTVLISASDFIGISTIEISTNKNFPSNGTTIIDLSSSAPQQYLQNINFDFGNNSSQFANLVNSIGGNIKYVYLVNINNVESYLIITDTSVYINTNNTTSNIYNLSSSIFTTSVIANIGILLGDSVGNIYNYVNKNVQLITSCNLPITSCAVLSINTYFGVSQVSDPTAQISDRQRIFTFSNSSLTAQNWSTQIPEPEVTFLYATSFGLIIGSWDQIKLIGKIWLYDSSTQKLTLQYSTFYRPDVAYYSSNSGNLYVGFGGSKIFYSPVVKSVITGFISSSLVFVGTVFKQINNTRITGKIIVITNLAGFIFDETNFTTITLATPSYSPTDSYGLLTLMQNNDLGLTNLPSSYVIENYTNINTDPNLLGYSSNFSYNAFGYLFSNISTSANYFLQYPNSFTPYITINGSPISLNNNTFTQNLIASTPISFSLSISGQALTGVGTIALYNGLSSSGNLVGINSFISPKNLNWYVQTGSTEDIFGYSDGTLKTADTSYFATGQYTVYARFTDTYGNRSSINNLISDNIYSQIQQQSNNQATPSGRIVEINPNQNVNNVNLFTPQPDGSSNYIYSGTKMVRETGVFESDPFYAADVTTWSQIQVLALIPGYQQDESYIQNPNSFPPDNYEWGTSVTLYVKTAGSLMDLNDKDYINSYSLSTIDNYTNYQNQIVSILGNIASLSGQWIQFKLVLTTASKNITPVVQSVLITYSGAGTSQFLTKTFNASTQSSITPTPQFRRGILTANFVTNGGSVSFGYTTDPTNVNPSTYIPITPNKIFTLSSPSSTIKFGVILKSSTSNAAFFDEFAVQMDMGPNNLYFMPPQAAFTIKKYVNSSGIAVTNGYQFVNNSIGIISSYNWSFGTSYPLGIATFVPPNEDSLAGPAINRQNPIIIFSTSAVQTIGLFITGYVENNIVYNSEFITKQFIST